MISKKWPSCFLAIPFNIWCQSGSLFISFVKSPFFNVWHYNGWYDCWLSTFFLLSDLIISWLSLCIHSENSYLEYVLTVAYWPIGVGKKTAEVLKVSKTTWIKLIPKDFRCVISSPLQSFYQYHAAHINLHSVCDPGPGWKHVGDMGLNIQIKDE